MNKNLAFRIWYDIISYNNKAQILGIVFKRGYIIYEVYGILCMYMWPSGQNTVEIVVGIFSFICSSLISLTVLGEELFQVVIRFNLRLSHVLFDMKF